MMHENSASPVLTAGGFIENEDNGTAEFVVTYNGPTMTSAFTADYIISDGTAISGTDYGAVLTGQVSFPANTINGSQSLVTVNLIDDALLEGNEELNFQISNPSDLSITINVSNATGSIMDNEISTSNGLSVADFNVNEDGLTADFVITYNGLTVQNAFTTDYTIVDGSTTSGSDYSGAVTGQISFPPLTSNGARQTVTINIIDDTTYEGNENVFLGLSNISTTAVGYVDYAGEGIIIDNDPRVIISLQNEGIVVTEGTETFVRFTVEATGNQPQDNCC